jgi:hypothetical protein
VGCSQGGNSCPHAEDQWGRWRLLCVGAEREKMAGASSQVAKRDERGGGLPWCGMTRGAMEEGGLGGQQMRASSGGGRRSGQGRWSTWGRLKGGSVWAWASTAVAMGRPEINNASLCLNQFF